MSNRWIDALSQTFAASGPWAACRRVEASHHGGWLLMAADAKPETGWLRVPADGGEPEPVNPLDDDGLSHMGRRVKSWRLRGYRVQMLAWRVGRRAVFRVTTPRGSRIFKFFRKDRDTHARWTALGNSPDGRWRVPRVHDWKPSVRMIALQDCPGQTLNARWLGGRAHIDDGQRLASILEWLHAARIPIGFPSYGVEDEVRLLERRLASFERTLACPPERARHVASRVIRVLQDSPAAPPTFCHRDFYDKQVLLDDDGDGGYVIDFDLAAAGPPALDPGNMLAHLRLRALKGVILPWTDIARTIARGAVVDRDIADSLYRWTASALMRLTLIYARRRRSPDLLERLLDTTEAALGRQGEWRGLL